MSCAYSIMRRWAHTGHEQIEPQVTRFSSPAADSFASLFKVIPMSCVLSYRTARHERVLCGLLLLDVVTLCSRSIWRAASSKLKRVSFFRCEADFVCFSVLTALVIGKTDEIFAMFPSGCTTGASWEDVNGFWPISCDRVIVRILLPCSYRHSYKDLVKDCNR